MWSVVRLGRGPWGNGSQVSGPACPSCPCAFGGSSLPLTPPFPRQACLCLAPRASDPRSGPRVKPWLSCGFQLFEAAVVASSKSGCGSAADETQGVIYSRVALGPGARPRPGESQGLLIRDQQNETDEVLERALRPPGG